MSNNNNSSDSVNSNIQVKMPNHMDPNFSKKFEAFYNTLEKKKDTKKNMLNKFKCDAFSEIYNSGCKCAVTEVLKTNYDKMVKVSDEFGLKPVS